MNQTQMGNKLRHWEARRRQNAALGVKGTACAWSDQARALATAQARQGDHGAWADLAAVLETFCVRLAVAGTRRAENQSRHWEEKRAALQDASASARVIALAWWDRARAVAADQGDAGWNDLARTLSNYCDRYSG